MKGQWVGGSVKLQKIIPETVEIVPIVPKKNGVDQYAVGCVAVTTKSCEGAAA